MCTSRESSYSSFVTPVKDTRTRDTSGKLMYRLDTETFNCNDLLDQWNTMMSKLRVEWGVLRLLSPPQFVKCVVNCIKWLSAPSDAPLDSLCKEVSHSLDACLTYLIPGERHIWSLDEKRWRAEVRAFGGRPDGRNDDARALACMKCLATSIHDALRSKPLLPVNELPMEYKGEPLLIGGPYALVDVEGKIKLVLEDLHTKVHHLLLFDNPCRLMNMSMHCRRAFHAEFCSPAILPSLQV